MSIKNKLQEHCQKYYGSVPLYNTECIRFDPPPLFLSRVTLPNNETFEGEVANSKKESQKSAARKAYLALFGTGKPTENQNKISSRNEVHKYSPPVNPKRYILVDAESIPQALTSNKFGDWCPESDYLVGFAGYCSSQASMKQSSFFEQVCEFHITDSATSDAADHSLSFYAGIVAHQYMNNSEKPAVIIISRDKFAATTVERLKKYGFKDVRHLSRPQR